MKILKFGEATIKRGVAFNPQPSGESGLWILTDETNDFCEIKVDDLFLKTSVNKKENLLTAILPDWMIEDIGLIKIEVYDRKNDVSTEPQYITIVESENSKNLNIDYKEKYFAAQKELYVFKSKERPQFSGWGMETLHSPCWNTSFNSEIFLKAHTDLMQNFDLTPENFLGKALLNELKWRHWNVGFAVRMALKGNSCRQLKKATLVECGVGDGKTAFFALREASQLKYSRGIDFKMHLFDSWGAVKREFLAGEEQHLEGKYSDLSLLRTQKNLKEFSDSVVYYPGYIPDIFSNLERDLDEVRYLHLDLNGVIPTVAALEFFFPLMKEGGVILLDDYGWEECRSTKNGVDGFFKDKTGDLLTLPTGQAFYFIR